MIVVIVVIYGLKKLSLARIKTMAWNMVDKVKETVNSVKEKKKEWKTLSVWEKIIDKVSSWIMRWAKKENVKNSSVRTNENNGKHDISRWADKEVLNKTIKSNDSKETISNNPVESLKLDKLKDLKKNSKSEFIKKSVDKVNDKISIIRSLGIEKRKVVEWISTVKDKLSNNSEITAITKKPLKDMNKKELNQFNKTITDEFINGWNFSEETKKDLREYKQWREKKKMLDKSIFQERVKVKETAEKIKKTSGILKTLDKKVDWENQPLIKEFDNINPWVKNVINASSVIRWEDIKMIKDENKAEIMREKD